MAYSRQRAVSDGTLQRLDVAISYIRRADINVLLDGINTDNWAWAGNSGAIQFPSPVPSGVEVTIVRATQSDKVIHEFAKGAKFVNTSVDQDFRQMLYLAQEYTEGSGSNNPAINQPVVEDSTGDGAFTYEKYKSRYNWIANGLPYCTVDTSGTDWTIDTWIPIDAYGLRSMVAFNFEVAGTKAYIIGGHALRFKCLTVENAELFSGGAGLVITASRNQYNNLRFTIAGAPAGGNVKGWVKQL